MATDSLIYGKRGQGRGDMVYSFPIGASEVFKTQGAGWVTVDGSGRVELAGAADTAIIGWMLIQNDFTSSSTEGGSKAPVDLDLQGIFEVPIDTGTWADTMRGETCDLAVTSNVLGANLSASAVDIIELVDKGYTRSDGTVVSVLAKLYINNLTRTGVA